MPKQIARFRPRGFRADPPASELPNEFYSGGVNVRFRDGVAERIGSNRSIYATVQADVRNMLNVLIGGTNYWVYHGDQESYAVQSTTHTAITHASGLTAQADASKWTSGLFNGFPFANNQLDAPMYWGGNVGTPFVSLAGWPASYKCKTLLAHRYHLFALDITDNLGANFPNQIMWSDAAAAGAMPSTWTAGAANEAGSIELADSPYPLITGRTLRDGLIVYKRNATYLGSYVGRPLIFDFAPLQKAFGALTRHAVESIGGAHFVVTDGDAGITDGIRFKPAAHGQVANYLFKNLNESVYELIRVLYNRGRREVLIFAPLFGSTTLNVALPFYPDTGAFGAPRELSGVECAALGIVDDGSTPGDWNSDTGTWDADTSAWDEATFSLARESVVVGVPATPAMIELDTLDSVALDARIERYDLTFGEPERIKLVRAVHVPCENFGTLYVRVGGRNNLTDAITWSSTVITSPDQIGYLFAQGRYISYELRTEGAEQWRSPGFDLEYRLGGYY